MSSVQSTVGAPVLVKLRKMRPRNARCSTKIWSLIEIEVPTAFKFCELERTVRPTNSFTVTGVALVIARSRTQFGRVTNYSRLPAIWLVDSTLATSVTVPDAIGIVYFLRRRRENE